MRMGVKLILTQNDKTIENNINKAIADKFNNLFTSKKHIILNRLKAATVTWVLASPEIESLKDTSPYRLGAQFGLTSDPTAAITSAIVNSIDIKLTKITKNLKGNISFNFQPKQFRNLLDLPEGHTITEKGEDLHWMDWLLTRGDEIIIVGYRYDPGNDGRSGGGSMTAGSGFRVNPLYSGTVNDNFVTRLFSNREQEIQNIIIRSLNV